MVIMQLPICTIHYKSYLFVQITQIKTSSSRV